MLPVSTPRLTDPAFSLSDKDRPAQAGFTLIITIVLMAFLVLLMVSMASLTRVETQLAANSQQAAAARENALLALKLALGKLQAAAGPDQRITATADVVSATTHTSKKFWTGVWDPTSATPSVPKWLVSDPTPAALAAAPTLNTTQNFDDTSGTVRLVGAGSTDLTATAPSMGNEIILAKQPLSASGIPGQSSGPSTIGNYAWWIGDEGVKARINLVDPNTPRAATTTGSPALGSVTPSETQMRQSLMVPGRVGGELMSSADGTAASPVYWGDSLYWGANPNEPTANPNLFRDLGKILTENQVELVGSGSASRDIRKRRFHDFTVTSRGVLADVAAGGLKKDLTAGLLGSAIPAGAPANIDPLITIPSDRNVPVKLPSWGALRSYVRLPLDYNITGSSPSVSAIAPTDTSMGIGPVILHHQLWVTATIESGNKLNLLYFPAVVLWNPYDVTLKAQNYTGQFWFKTIESSPGVALFPSSANFNPSPSVYAEYGARWKWSQSSIFTTYNTAQYGCRSKGIVISCPDLPPGKAYVFTPSANQNYVTATNSAPLNLSVGWRTNFWYEDLTATAANRTGASTPAPAITDIPSRLIIGLSTSNMDFELFVNPTLRSTKPYSPQGNASHKIGLGVVSASGTTASPAPLNNTFPQYLGRTIEVPKNISTGSFNVMPTGVYSGSPTFGWIVTQKMGQAYSARDIAWLANYNPAAQFINRSTMDGTGFNTQGGYIQAANLIPTGFSTSFSDFTVPTSASNEVYVGYDLKFTSWNLTKTVLFHVPRKETGVLSLAALQHANVHPLISTFIGDSLAPKFGYSASNMPTYPIGNSYADPRIAPTDTTGVLAKMPIQSNLMGSSTTAGQVILSHFDLSLLLNRQLWDKYFFSGVPTSSQLSGASLSDDASSITYYSANRRYSLYDPTNQGLSAKAADLQNYDRASANLLVEGAFNINSTSRDAWRAVLASARNNAVIKRDGSTALINNNQTTPIPRSPYPGGETAYTALTQGNSDMYDGFRALTDGQLDELATAMVAQVKARAADGNYGPVRSMADFVNRRPEATTASHRLKGPLQAAVDTTTINGSATFPGLNNPADLSALSTLESQFDPYFNLTDVKAAGSIPRAACLPGFVTQADILQQLGPVLSARSDTFRIRAYGDNYNPATGAVISRAWCEAIVQRLPDYMDPTANAPEAPLTSLVSGSTNAIFGRRFQIVFFRWLSPSDL